MFTRSIVFAACCGLGLLTLPAQADDDKNAKAADAEAKAEQLFQDGRKALFQGRYEDAVKLLKQAVAADVGKTKTSYQLNLARAHRYAGQPEESEKLLAAVLKRSPDHVEAGQRLGLEPVPDLFVGAVRFIAGWVDVAAERFLPQEPPPTWVAAGGGVRNAALMAALGATRSVRSSSSVGVDPDAREALVFAALAARALVGEPVTRPETTGARAGRVLGKLSSAPPA